VPRASLLVTAVLALTTAALPVSAQQGDPSLLTIRRIFASGEFASEPFGPTRWLEDGTAYTTLEPSGDGAGADLVRYDAEKGTREVMVTARQLVPSGENEPLEVEDYGWSPDGTMLLIFTNT
jgi:dipeptidyl-peptidase-4